VLYKLSGDCRLYGKFSKRQTEIYLNPSIDPPEMAKLKIPSRDKGSNMTLGKGEASRNEYNFHIIAEKVMLQVGANGQQSLIEGEAETSCKKQCPHTKSVEYSRQGSERYTPKFISSNCKVIQKTAVNQNENQNLSPAKNLHLIHAPSLGDIMTAVVPPIIFNHTEKKIE